MQEELKKRLSKDPNNGLLTYEYIANHIGSVDKILPELVEIMIMVDKTGQFVVSTEELKASDDNFRRIYKRLYPVGM